MQCSPVQGVWEEALDLDDTASQPKFHKQTVKDIVF